MKQLRIIILILTSAVSLGLNAQMLDFANKIEVILDDDTPVVLYGESKSLDASFSNRYYYLPTGLRLSKKANGIPELIFAQYTEHNSEDLKGGLIHFLMHWGLTKEQEKEVEQKLRKKVRKLAVDDIRYKDAKHPVVAGAANVTTPDEKSFYVVSAVLSDGQMTPSMVTSGHAPLIPGGKVAVAAILKEPGAKLLNATFQKDAIMDISVGLRFKYQVLMPAVEGRITVDWERIDSVYQTYFREATHVDGGSKGQGDDTVTDLQRDSLFAIFIEKKAVHVELESLQPDSPVAQEMIQAFMEYFLSSIAEKEFGAAPKSDPDDLRNDQRKYKNTYESYTVDRERWNKKVQRQKEVYTLNVRLPITREMDLVENLGSIYDAEKYNKHCLTKEVLDDPFWTHRAIHLINGFGCRKTVWN